MNNVDTVQVKMWGTVIGYLHQEDNGLIGFQYDSDFIKSNIQISPIKMPLSEKTYLFPNLPENTFKGLPGMVADSLPDKFGNIVIKQYLANQGRSKDDLSIIESLCYTGKRGMGVFEYEPAVNDLNINDKIDLDALTKLASEILSAKENTHYKKAEI